MKKTKKNDTGSVDLNGTTPVLMRVSDDTLSKIDGLQRWLEVNKTDAVARSIRLALNICKELEAGSTVELHRDNGDVRELVLAPRQ